jgi:hypothetical protein
MGVESNGNTNVILVVAIVPWVVRTWIIGKEPKGKLPSSNTCNEENENALDPGDGVMIVIVWLMA